MTYQTERLTMWFDGRLVLRKSLIHNMGIFATHDTRAGELLMLVTSGLVVIPEDGRSGSLQLAPDLYDQESLAEGVCANAEIVAIPHQPLMQCDRRRDHPKPKFHPVHRFARYSC